MRFLLSASIFFLACGQSQFNTHDPYADAGQHQRVDGGTTGGGTAGGGGGATGGGGGATGGGGGATGGGGGGSASCSSANCQGCCAGTVCQPGTSNAQCGQGGVACVACPAASDICKADQTCGIDPASIWEVLPTAAVVAPKNGGGGNWDSSSPPDPELGLWCPASEQNLSAVMPKVSDSFNPTWSSGGCTASASGLLADGVGFDAIDIDSLVSDQITYFSITTITEADLRAGTKTVGPTEGLDSMTLRLTKQ
jgi:hypothetical protein